MPGYYLTNTQAAWLSLLGAALMVVGLWVGTP